jgi:hypothetical protein
MRNPRIHGQTRRLATLSAAAFLIAAPAALANTTGYPLGDLNHTAPAVFDAYNPPQLGNAPKPGADFLSSPHAFDWLSSPTPSATRQTVPRG